MSVKRYEVNGSSSVLEDETGSLVDYEDYAALEQRLIESERYGRQTDITIDNLEMKLAQMAAENAGLKQFPDQIVGFIGKLGSSEIGSETKEKIKAAAKKIKTPATDDFMAEVRASGIDQWIASRDGRWNGTTAEAEKFAAQLRKGVQS